MKKLLDETSDGLTRALLVAGLEHRPPAGNKAQVIVALGAGGALGLFSSNALAWLGTTSGKLTVFGAAVGMAGAVYATVLPGSEASGPVASGSSAQRSPVTAGVALERAGNAPLAAGAGRVEVSPAGAVERPPVAFEGRGSANVEPASDRDDVRAGDVRAGDVRAEDVRAEDVRAEDVESPVRGARNERRLAKIVAPKLSEPRRNGPLSAVLAPPAVGAIPAGALAARAPEADARQGGLVQAIAVDPAAAVGPPGATNPSLDAEVKLVDDMHWAVRRNDRQALGRFLETYRVSFPDGQLKKEVAEFAVRLERPSR